MFNRPHRLKPLLERARLLFLDRQRLAFDPFNSSVFAKQRRLDTEIIQTRRLDVLDVRSQLRRPRRKPRPLLPQSLCLMPQRPQTLVELRHPRAKFRSPRH